VNTPRSTPPSEGEIDTLLARRYRDTSPEFEARWVALKRELRSAPAGERAGWFNAWWQWAALGSAAAAAALIFAVWSRPGFDGGRNRPSPVLAELFEMEFVLGRATALLDAESREALLHLPATSQPRS